MNMFIAYFGYEQQQQKYLCFLDIIKNKKSILAYLSNVIG